MSNNNNIRGIKKLLSAVIAVAMVASLCVFAVPAFADVPVAIDLVKYSVSSIAKTDVQLGSADRIVVEVSVTFDSDLADGVTELGYLSAGIGYDPDYLELVDTSVLRNSIEISDEFIAGFNGPNFDALYDNGSDGDIFYLDEEKIPSSEGKVAQAVYSKTSNGYIIPDGSTADVTVKFATFTFKAVAETSGAETLLWFDDVTCVAGEGEYGEEGTKYADYEVVDGVGLPSIDSITIEAPIEYVKPVLAVTDGTAGKIDAEVTIARDDDGNGLNSEFVYIVALYNENKKMLDCEVVEVLEGDIVKQSGTTYSRTYTFDKPEQSENPYVKLMLWNSATDITPFLEGALGEAVEEPVTYTSGS